MANAFDRCITEALLAQRITQEKADELRDQLDKFVAQGLSLADERRAALALDQLNTLEFDALRRKANVVRQGRANAWNTAEAMTHVKGGTMGVLSKLVRDPTGFARWGNVDSQIEILQKRFQSMVAEPISAMRAKGLFGQKKDFVMAEQAALELRGHDTGSATAKAFAHAWGDVFEYSKMLYNRAGGNIRTRADWGTPQWHDAGSVLRAGKTAWKDFVRPLLDPDRMINAIDGTPMSQTDLEGALEASYESITSVTMSRSGGSLANKHGDHRVLVFKDADGWLQYNRRFGEPDVFAGFIRHIDHLAKEIGAMQVLGPNPDAGVLALQESLLEHLGAKQLGPIKTWLRNHGWNVNNPETAVRRVEGLWETVMGRSATPGSIVQMSQAVRTLNVSTKLGSAAVSSLTDEASMARTALWNGISPVKVMRRELEQMTNEEARVWAVRAGIGWDSWVRNGVATNRFVGEALGQGYVAMLAEGTMRASGLNFVTDARRAAFGMEFLGALGDIAGRSLDQLRAAGGRDAKVAGALERYGISASDWDAMRADGAVDFQGATYLHPQILLESGAPQRLSDALMRMVLTETDYAVPTPRALERYLATGGSRAGTGKGELFRHLFQFKTFSITMMTTHLSRGLVQQGARGKAAYLVPFAIMLTGGGAVVMQARAILQGRDPEDMDDKAFWGRAFTQGGGAGLFGDFFSQGITGSNRFGNSFLISMAGPSAGMAEDAAKVLFPTLQGDLSPKGKIDFATRHLMPGSSLWYARLAVDRQIKDRLVELVDPAAARRSFAARDRFYRERGSKFWWKQGESLPGGG